MTTWFTADLHLGHANIIKYCQRPFMTADERALTAEDPRGRWRISAQTVHRHDESLIGAINARVAPDDVLWILGDFCWGDLHDALGYRQRIGCRTVNLVWGNHDHRTIRPAFNDTIEQGMIRVDGQQVWLNHYPMRSWNKAFHGAWHLYGHVHGKLEAEDRQRPWTLTKDVGVDACDYRPWSYDDLVAYMSPRLQEFERRKASLVQGTDVEMA